MEPLADINSALDDVFTFQRDLSQMKLLTPLPLLSSERQAMLALADDQEAEATRLLLRVCDLKKSAILKRFSYSAARSLLPEILSKIFVLAMDPEWFQFQEGRLPYFSVLEVSRWWRSVAIGTPELWADIILFYSSNYSEKSIANLAIWLERARNSKLRVYMYGWNEGGSDDHLKETIWLMICSHLNHCSKLMHHSESTITKKHAVMLCNSGDIYEDMVSLELSTDRDNLDAPPPLISPSLPRLRFLKLEGGVAKWDIQFMAQHLEKLSLGHIDISCRSLCDILNRYPVALKLELDCVDISAAENGSIQPCQLELEELTLAHFTSTQRFWICIMPALRALQTLVIREFCYILYDSMPVLPSVKHLVFDLSCARMLYRHHQYRHFLNRIPHITEVTIDTRAPEVYFLNIRYSDPIIRDLYENQPSVVCPQIRHVGIYGCKSSQKRILRLSRTRTAFRQLADNAKTSEATSIFTVTTKGCLALEDVNCLSLPELEEVCKKFPQRKLQRQDEEDEIYECVEDCECSCRKPRCDCCDHWYPDNDSADDPQ